MNPVQTARALPVVVATAGRTESDSALVLGRLLGGSSEGMRIGTGDPPDLDHMPRRIVVGIDFSETSIRAARLALRIAGFGASVYLVHVLPRDQKIRERTHAAILELFEESEREEAAHTPSANDALHDLRDRLRVPAGTTVRPMVVHGDPATELLAFASGIKADVIVAGANGQGLAGRTMVGRVASRLVRHSRRSVLIVPQAGVVAHAMSA